MTCEQNERGFVLVATLWFVAALAFAAAIMQGWVARGLANSSGLADRLAARQQTIGTLDTVAYLVSTNYFSVRGLEDLGGEELARASSTQVPIVVQGGTTPFLALDNRPYRRGDAVVRLQDTRGLYNLLWANEQNFETLVGAYGVPYEARPGLWSGLADYMGYGVPDGDAPAYAAAGRLPPRMAPLLTPWETRKILGWDDQPTLWQAVALPEIVSINTNGGLNPNTAPAVLLRTLPGMTDDAVARVIAYREAHPIVNMTQFVEVSGDPHALDPLYTLFYPADSVRLEVTLPGEPLTRVFAISKTALGTAPYRIDYAFARPHTTPAPDAAGLAALPAFPAQSTVAQ